MNEVAFRLVVHGRIEIEGNPMRSLELLVVDGYER